MADIAVTCPACGNQFRVSEYVDPGKLLCAKCGAAIPPPAPSAAAEIPSGKLRLAAAKPEQAVAPAPAAETNITQAWMLRRQQHAKRVSMRHHLSLLDRLNSSMWFNWATFLILAGIGCYLRYFDPPMFSGVQTELRFWGAMALLACHVTIVISAFSDDVFQGMLCLLIPGYSLYHLFAVSDEYLLRALTAALVMVFGLDAWQYVSAFCMDVYDGVNRWMRAGGDLNNEHIFKR